jgi:hypothetical protein
VTWWDCELHLDKCCTLRHDCESVSRLHSLPYLVPVELVDDCSLHQTRGEVASSTFLVSKKKNSIPFPVQ